jgi:NADH-quinone oxidoreductase subunit C
MSVWLSGHEVARLVRSRLPEAVEEESDGFVAVDGQALIEVCQHLQRELAINYLNNLTAVDYLDYIEVVYHLSSLERNHLLTLKVRCYDRDNPEVPSLMPLWQGADLQEGLRPPPLPAATWEPCPEAR